MGRRRVEMMAVTVALRARSGALTPETVAALSVQAREHLADGSFLAGAINHFCRRYVEVHRDAAALADIGSDLHRAVLLDLVPEPLDLHRRDIHG